MLCCRVFGAYFLVFHALFSSVCWAPFLETPDNVPSPKTILCAEYSPIVIQFLVILKAKF